MFSRFEKIKFFMPNALLGSYFYKCFNLQQAKVSVTRIKKLIEKFAAMSIHSHSPINQVSTKRFYQKNLTFTKSHEDSVINKNHELISCYGFPIKNFFKCWTLLLNCEIYQLYLFYFFLKSSVSKICSTTFQQYLLAWKYFTPEYEESFRRI